MKTILARFNKVDSKGFGKTIQTLKDLGVQVEDNNKQLLGTTTIMENLSDKYDTFSKNEQKMIASSMGFRQVNRFEIILQQWKKIEEYRKVAMSADGEVSNEYLVYLDSIEGKMQKLKAISQEAFTSMMNSDNIKMFYDMGIGVMNFVNNVGLLKVTLFTLTNVLLLTNKAFRSWITSMNVAKIKGFISNISMMPWYLSTAVKEMGFLKGMTFALGTTFDMAKIKAIALQSALTLGLSVAITGIISGVTKLISKTQEAKQQQEEFLRTASQKFSQVNDIQKLVNQYDALQNTYKDLKEKGQDSTEQQETMLEIHNKIADQFPDLISKTERYGIVLDQNIDKIKKMNEEELKSYERQLLSKQKEAEQKIEQLRTQKKRIEKELEEYEEKVKRGDMFYTLKDKLKLENLFDSPNDLDKSDNFAKKLSELDIELTKTSDSLKEQEKIISDYHQIQQTRIKDILDEVKAEKMNEEQKSKLIKSLEEQGFVIDDINVAFDVYNDILSKAQNSVDDLTDSVDNYDDSIRPLAETQQEFANILKDTKSEVITLDNALAEYNKKGKFTEETILSLVEKYPDLLEKLSDEKELEQELIDIKQDKLTAIEETLNSQLGLESTYVNDLADRYVDDIENFRTKEEDKLKILAEAVEKRKNFYKSEISVLEKELDSAIERGDMNTANNIGRQLMMYGDGLGITTHDTELLTSANKMIKAKEKILSILEDTSDLEKSMKDDKDSTKSQKEVKDLTDRYYTLNNAITEVQNELDKLNNLENEDNKTEILKQQIELLEKQAEAYKNLGKEQSKELSELKESLSNQGINFDSNGSISNYNSMLDGLKNNALGLKDEDRDKAIKELEDLQAEMNKYTDIKFKLIPESTQNVNNIKKQVIDINNEIANIQQEVDQKRLDMVKKTQDKVKEILVKRYESEKEEALKTLNDIESEREKAHNRRLKRIEKEKNAQLDKFDAMLKEIDRAEGKHDYENNREKLLNDKASLLRQKSNFDGVNTREARANAEELTRQIKDIDFQLNELSHDRSVDLKKQQIQDAKDTYSDKMDLKTQELNESYELEKEQFAKKRVLLEDYYKEKLTQENILAETSKALTDGVVEHTRKTIIKGVIKDIKEEPKKLHDVISDYMYKFDEQIVGTGELIENDIIDNLQKVLDLVKELGKNGSFVNIDLNGSNNVDVKGSHAGGGIIDYTGLAMVHGGNGHNEYMFNSNQMEKLIKNITAPVLSIPRVISNSFQNHRVNGAMGGVNIEMPITVEGNLDKTVIPNLENITEQVAGKIMSKIYK